MSTWYLDTSAALKLIVDEPESQTLATILDESGVDIVSSILLETEMRRAAQRIFALRQVDVSDLLASVTLVEAPPSVFREAGQLPGTHLRSLEAIHLASAIRLGVDAIVTYDQRLGESATDLGLRVVAPQGGRGE